MNHVSERDLAFHATDPELPTSMREHLAACSACRETLESFRSAIGLVTRAERVPELPDSRREPLVSRREAPLELQVLLVVRQQPPELLVQARRLRELPQLA